MADTDEIPDNIQEVKSAGSFYALTHTAAPPIIGKAGMLQYHFTDESLAAKFLAWTREQKHIKKLEKAYIEKKFNDEKKAVYIIRLTKKQQELLKKIPSAEIKTQESLLKDEIEKCAKQLWDDKLTCEELTQVINNNNAAVISKAMTIAGDDQWTGFQTLACIHPGDAFKLLVLKADAKAISTALIMANNAKWTGFQMAARYQPGDAFSLLLQKADAKVINTALTMMMDQKWTGFQMAACYQPGDAFKLLLQKADPKAINTALTMANNENWTGFHAAAMNQSGDTYQLLLQIADAKAINTALTVTNDKNWTGFQMAASHQPGNVFNLLIQTASAEAINRALPIANNKGDTALHNIVWFQPENVVLNLITKASKEALSTACLKLNNINQSVLECALSYLPAATIAALLNKIDDQALHFMVANKIQSPRLASSVMSNIIFEPSWQTEPLLGKLCKMLNPDVTLFCCEAWLNGHDISPAVIKAVQPYLPSVIQDLKNKGSENTEKIIELEKMAAAWNEQDHKEIKQLDEKGFFTTRLGSVIPINTKNENQLKQLYKEGLKSPADFRLMKKWFPQSIATQIAEDLRRSDRLYRGTHTPIDLNLKEYQEYPDHYLKIIKQGNAIFKIVKPQYKDDKGVLRNDWPDFVKQFKDYRFRPELREKTVKSLFRSKFHHRTGKMIDFKEHKPADKKKTYFSTKKQSATLLSKRLNTTVFGEQHANNILVGILADISCHMRLEKELPKKEELKPNEYIYTDGDEKNGGKLFYIDDQKHAHPMQLKTFDEKQQLPSKPLAQLTPQEKEQLKKAIAEHHDRRINKALLSRDKGTYFRKWVGDKRNAEQHADEMKDINYTDLEKFKAMVDEYPNRLNELLTKFTLGSMLGILLVSDNLESKKIAIERQQDIKREFKIDLPIIHYNRALRQMRIYSPREQQDDLTGKNKIILNEYKNKLSLIKNAIMKKRCWYHGFFYGSTLLPPEEMKQVLTLINTAENNPQTYPDVYNKIKTVLANTKQKSLWRSEDVREMGEQLFSYMK